MEDVLDFYQSVTLLYVEKNNKKFSSKRQAIDIGKPYIVKFLLCILIHFNAFNRIKHFKLSGDEITRTRPHSCLFSARV